MNQLIYYNCQNTISSKPHHISSKPFLLFPETKYSFELALITSIFTTMKNYASVRNIESALPHSQLQRESPARAGFMLALPSPESHFRTRPSAFGSGEREKEQDSTDVLLTERTGGTSDNPPPKQPRASNIKTYLRIRPCGTPSPLLHLHGQQSVFHERTCYKFNSIFEAGASQQHVFAEAGQEATRSFLEGYNATIFAYGSTGSGKTYTMFGNDDGLVPSVVREIFGRMEAGARLSCSMIEIYRESLTDLLSVGGPELKIKDAGSSSCVVHNLSSHPIACEADALALIKRGNILKKIRETDLNECSSRSHVVFTLLLERTSPEGRSMECRFNLVDLAGSEKVGKSKVQGEGLEEAKKINLSLSCLGNTISALVRGSDHIPFRESKLTRILKESLVGNSLTRLIVTCSLTDDALEDTISSMKFAQRAQKVQTQAEIAYNASRGKGQREDRLRCLQSAVDRLDADATKISLLLNRQPCECSNCAEVKLILSKKPALPVFTFHPLPNYRSPKQNDNKQYFSNASLQRGKSNTFLKTNYQNWLEGSADRETFHRRLNDLRVENDKLREDKMKLQGRIRSLEERTAQKDKEKNKGKKVIRLGERQSRSNKENQMGLANGVDKGRKEEREREDKQLYLRTQVQSEPSCIKEHDCQQTLHLIQQAISKLETACNEYRNALYPLHLDILNQQIALLQAKTSPNKPFQPPNSPTHISALLITLQKKMCSYIDSVGDIIPRLLQGSRCESRHQLSEVLREKLREVSDIKWSFKEFYEQPEQLQAISELLRPLSSRPLREAYNLHQSSQISAGSGQNEFLNLDPATFQPILHEPIKIL